MGEAPLFADLRFNVSLSRRGVDDLGPLIRAHGGRLCDASDAAESSADSGHGRHREGEGRGADKEGEGEAQREAGLVFVVDSFDDDNKAFQELVAKGVRIISSRCLYESVSLKKPLPATTFPLYARYLEGELIAFDESVEADKVAALRNLARYMGATIVDPYEKKATLLIAEKVGSISYRLAHQQGARVVTPVWLRDCWSQKALQKADDYLLPTFAGLLIAVTGLSSATRAEIQRLSTAYGATYMANLSRRCTHLLTANPEGVKYRFAVEWGIHCVTTQWFFDSINKKACQDETNYFVPMSEESRNNLLNPANINRFDLTRLSPALRRTQLLKWALPDVQSSVIEAVAKRSFSRSPSHPQRPSPPHVSLKPSPLASQALERKKAQELLAILDTTIAHYTALGQRYDLTPLLSQLTLPPPTPSEGQSDKVPSDPSVVTASPSPLIPDASDAMEVAHDDANAPALRSRL